MKNKTKSNEAEKPFLVTSISIDRSEDNITTIHKNNIRLLSTVFTAKENFDNAFCIIFGLKKNVM